METNNSNTNLNQDERFPNVEKARRKNLFTVPEGYFNQLPGAIADQINAGKQPVTYGRNYKPVVLGLSLILAIALMFGVNYFRTIENKEVSQPVISYQDIHLTELEDEDIYDEITVEDLADTTVQDAVKSEMYDYLIENNTDISLIINEL